MIIIEYLTLASALALLAWTKSEPTKHSWRGLVNIVTSSVNEMKSCC